MLYGAGASAPVRGRVRKVRCVSGSDYFAPTVCKSGPPSRPRQIGVDFGVNRRIKVNSGVGSLVFVFD